MVPLPFKLSLHGRGTSSANSDRSARQMNKSPASDLCFSNSEPLPASSVPMAILNEEWHLLGKSMGNLLKERKTKAGDGQNVCFPLLYNEKHQAFSLLKVQKLMNDLFFH